ncbi:MAG: hypothetical protein DRO36_04790, partial [Candidatus Hecatellales archaeon]
MVKNSLLVLGLILAASSCGFKFWVPRKAWFSLFNSPYPAHRDESALDVYYPENEVLMPLEEGRVFEVKWFEAPKVRRDGLNFEPLILIEVGGGKVVKVLHVKPSVKVGEKVRVGDPIGKPIISGYFLPWTGLHAHFELRKVTDPYRALGAYKLKLDKRFKVGLKNPCKKEGFVFRVLERSVDGVWVQPLNAGLRLGGLTVFSGRKQCFLDGGIPFHGYGVAVGGKSSPIKTLDGKVLGRV